MGQEATHLADTQLEGLRALFNLADGPLSQITSGWHKLVVLTEDRVFAFPRSAARVHMIEREAKVLEAWRFSLAPRVLGLHRYSQVWPHPFLEMTRLEGRSWDVVKNNSEGLSFDRVAGCLEELARLAARWHTIAIPPQLAIRPKHVGGGVHEPPSIHPRLNDRWTGPGGLAAMIGKASELLSEHMSNVEPQLWTTGLEPVISMESTTLHGELSDGQFLVDEDLHITGVVDWDGMHRGHPLIDLDLGVGAGRVYYERDRYTELRKRSWDAYARERSLLQPGWPQVNLLWSLLDVMALLHDGSSELWPSVLADLTVATQELRSM